MIHMVQHCVCFYDLNYNRIIRTKRNNFVFDCNKIFCGCNAKKHTLQIKFEHFTIKIHNTI